MKYSAEKRKTFVRHLKGALTVLPTGTGQGGSVYVCDCVRRATGYAHDTYVTTDMIAARLNGEFAIEQWLARQSPEVANAVRLDVATNNGRKLQAYRRAWVESMIAEFEA